ncbi:hypothetical protein PCANC_01529 [Puccinia coronata f. sp. avenae]|uniref:Uncharacterized protein n=1 Tax=Puccinia coronata f. sp. avenae TaxID=200324 RepID=A0A2N5RYN1_9BASI|nr:hypothetical protein PCANC_27695 [Puccinia coronata f. sp. avenae]PLW10781.1 hypothetical protein PCASD_21303 [Puccinia coronata f. sp. avenae]PLW51729.1 hypothetical protein PCASD_00549 [Puccinia coronata f. sp. avenae]PLW56537.1 hypothetical protein PCANC_01529 [Puccinia coronata f. sp. avenae]
MRFFRISHIFLILSLGDWVRFQDARPLELEKELSESHSRPGLPFVFQDLNFPLPDSSEPNSLLSNQPKHFGTGKRPLLEVVATSSSAHAEKDITKKPKVGSEQEDKLQEFYEKTLTDFKKWRPSLCNLKPTPEQVSEAMKLQVMKDQVMKSHLLKSKVLKSQVLKFQLLKSQVLKS